MNGIGKASRRREISRGSDENVEYLNDAANGDAGGRAALYADEDAADRRRSRACAFP